MKDKHKLPEPSLEKLARFGAAWYIGQNATLLEGERSVLKRIKELTQQDPANLDDGPTLMHIYHLAAAR